MGFQDAIGDSDVIDGLSIRFLKLIGLWNAINSYRTTGKRASVPKIHLIGYTDELRSVYNPMVTTTLGLGIIVLIFAAVLISLGSDPSVLFQIAQVFSFVFIEVSLFCLGSSLIETASSELDFAIYSSEWYKADVEFRKAAQMLMVRTRRNANLTALGMYSVNLETLEAILQFTYSATALTLGNI
ncbi:unnamed protein product [Nezara viridula]|uniref:Odorant receptor n=1 Tax=Nezara viridula TaxID=85310 RepID=A0A9P0MTA6_NEZVI|nr:unnamed protein product [Nezara viridula]